MAVSSRLVGADASVLYVPSGALKGNARDCFWARLGFSGIMARWSTPQLCIVCIPVGGHRHPERLERRYSLAETKRTGFKKEGKREEGREGTCEEGGGRQENIYIMQVVGPVDR
jgi:hypothetical protein